MNTASSSMRKFDIVRPSSSAYDYEVTSESTMWLWQLLITNCTSTS